MSNPVNDEYATKEIFNNYKNLGGKHKYDKFVKNLEKFYDLTLEIWIFGMYTEDGPQSREEAWELWTKYIKSSKEASRYFEAVDTFSAYT